MKAFIQLVLLSVAIFLMLLGGEVLLNLADDARVIGKGTFFISSVFWLVMNAYFIVKVWEEEEYEDEDDDEDEGDDYTYEPPMDRFTKPKSIILN